MDTTKLLIERTKAAIGAETDYRLAKVLGVSHTTLIHWRTGASRPDDLAVQQMSALIGCDPARVVAFIHADRARDPETRALWLRIAAKLANDPSGRRRGSVLFSHDTPEATQ